MPVVGRVQVYDAPIRAVTWDIDDLAQRHLRWIQRAMAVAAGSEHKFPMGSVAVRGGTLVGSAVNRFRNHPRVVDNWSDCSVHSESGLVAACNVAGATIYVARLARDGSGAIARPCTSCWRELEEAGARQVCWTIDAVRVGVASLG